MSWKLIYQQPKPQHTTHNMINTTIKYGSTYSIPRQYPEGATVAEIRNDSQLRALLNLPSTYNVVHEGVRADTNAPLQDGAVYRLEDVANEKG